MNKQPKSKPSVHGKQSLREIIRESIVQGITVDIPQTGLAYARMGASELAIALKACPDSIGPQETTGTVGNPTQQQISQGFEIYGKGFDAEPEVGNEVQMQAQPEHELDHELEPDV